MLPAATRFAPITGRHRCGDDRLQCGGGSGLGSALLMGVDSITARGCTVGQGLSGLSTLLLGRFIATASIIGGAVAALHWQVWRMDRTV